jgi:hypothetical protein
MSMEIWALVSDEEKRQLEAIAATKQLRTGTALREAIQEYLDHLQQAKPFVADPRERRKPMTSCAAQ